jgi:hypothetical protein
MNRHQFPPDTNFPYGFGQIGHEVVLELAGGLEVAGVAKRAPLGTDVVFDQDGAGWGLGPKASGVLAMFLTSAVGARAVGLVAAVGGAFAAPADVLEVVLDLGQPAPQFRGPRSPLSDPSLEGSHQGQDGGLGLGRNCVPERCGNWRSRNDTPYYEVTVQRVRPGNGSGCPRIPFNGRRTA